MQKDSSSAIPFGNDNALSAKQQQLLEASRVADQLATELQAKEEAMQKQADELTHLQDTLWSAEEALRDMHLKSLEDRERETFMEIGNSSRSRASHIHDGLTQLAPELKLLAVSTGEKLKAVL